MFLDTAGLNHLWEKIKTLLSGKANTSHTHDDRYIPLTGSTAITGTLRTNGELQSSTANGLRLVQGNYSFFIRNDGSNIYFMLTAAGDQYGNWNSLRPFIINNTNGGVSIGNGLTVSGGITSNNSATFNVNLTVKGNTQVARLDSSATIHINGISYLNGGVQVNGNGTAIKLIKCGTTVISASGTSDVLITLATVKSWYSAVNVTQTAIIVNNGDGGVNGTHIEGVTWVASDSAWSAVYNQTTTGNIRINYTVICW